LNQNKQVSIKISIKILMTEQLYHKG